MIDDLIDTLPPHQRAGYRGMFQRFIDWPPGTRVKDRARTSPADSFITAGDTGMVLTHSTDGCTLVEWDTPQRQEAQPGKPAAAWWTTIEELERV